MAKDDLREYRSKRAFDATPEPKPAIVERSGPLLFVVQIALLWPANTLMIFVIGRWFGHTPDLMRVARLMGFASAPLALAMLGVVPVEAVRIAVALLSTALWLATWVVGTRHALQTTTGRAAFVCVVMILILMFVSMVYRFLTA